MAARSPIMNSVKEHASRGGLVLGICNGFQILTETKLLPGALLANKTLTFICKPCYLKIERTDTPFTLQYKDDQVVQFPIAHHEGLFFLQEGSLKEIEKNGQVVFRYCTPSGDVCDEGNPNGSLNNIAGIVNLQGNVMGLMPHPERASEAILGGADGAIMWNSIKTWLERKGA
jgi:phosphoribosylformylglycinamidine synthase